MKARGEGDDRGGDGWMVSLTMEMVKDREAPGVLQSMGLQSQTGLSD